MTIQPELEDLASLIERSTVNTAPSAHAGAERHYLRLTLDNSSWHLDFECRHQPVTDEQSRCAGEDADEFGVDFLDWFTGTQPSTLRNGLVDIWWEGSGEDEELCWEYVTFVRPTTRGRQPKPASDANIDITDMDTVGVVTFDLRKLPRAAIVEHSDEVHRIMAIGDNDIEQGHGGNVDFYSEGFYEHQLLEAIAALRVLRAQ